MYWDIFIFEAGETIMQKLKLFSQKHTVNLAKPDPIQSTNLASDGFTGYECKHK